ncbi:MAG: sigma-70 family RNA polymerase sigma factor [Acidobacteria bacterium]|nr:sigma-70 family RNA polymerase sigma factor [Acidobacteriota bacterium]
MKRAPFDELVAKYQRLVLDLIRKYYGGQLRHLEDDLSQEIWIKLWSAFKKSESQIDDFKSYLYRTVQTTLWDAIRMVEKRSAVGLDDLELAEPESDLDSRMELETRMKGLSDEENLMIRAHLRGYNYDEIATMLDVSEGRVRNLMTRIKKKMAWRVQ